MGGLCEICGERPAVGRHAVEGTLLNVCAKCGRFGPQIREVFIPQKRPAPLAGPDEGENDFVPDFGRVVRSGRQRSGMTQKELAAKVNEKESSLANIERGDLLPSKQTADRLEKALGIRLFRAADAGKEKKELAKPKPSGAGLTLGDVVKLK
jgi:putative transcription factor